MTTVARPEAGAELVREPTAGLLGRALRSRPGEATWVAAAHLGVVALAAVLYLVNLTISGYANTYYSAAAQAASQSWSAWFFGSIDAANFITIDKPPLATMLMGLSVRLLGLSSWSVLLPEALAGVATVGVLFALVRRTFGPVAAAVAGVVAALTPAAVLMFRYNNPDALLTLLLVLAAYAFIRALETDRLRWVAVAAILVGFAFNTKYLQAYLVLPAFGLTYAIAAPGGLRRRIVGLAVALAGVIVSSGWWVLAVELLPVDGRPFIGGSTTNSALELVFGYDGLGRIFGQGGGGGGPSGGGFSGTPGLLRLFNPEFGGQVAWFLPMAFIGLATGLWARRHAPRTDRARAAYLFWGLWLLTHAVVFSFMSGIIHTYYAVVMAPAIGALVGGGVVALWRLRSGTRRGGAVLAAALVVSGALAWQLLERTPDLAPGLGLVVLAVTVLVAAVVVIPARLDRHRTQLLAAGLGLAVLLAGPASYAVDTMATAYSGGNPSSGPAASSEGPGGLGNRGGMQGGIPGGAPPSGSVGTGGAPPSGPVGTGGGIVGTGGGIVGTALADYLVANLGDARWIVAVSGAWEAGSIQLATGQPVMAMGGFNGGDPAPTLAELQDYVASDQLRFVIVGGRGVGGPAGDDGSDASASSVTNWVTSACTVVDYGSDGEASSALYDCASAVASQE